MRGDAATRTSAWLLACLLFGAPALADPPEEELTAAPGSIAYGMIEGAGAEGVFELVHDGQVTVRHVGSGMICRFLRDGAGGSIILFPGLPRGDDVGCSHQQPNNAVWTFYATSRQQAPSFQYLVEDVEATHRQRGRAPRRLHTSPPTTEELPEIRAQNYLLKMGRYQWFNSMLVAQVGDWTIQLRYSRPAPDSDTIAESERAAPLLFVSVLQEMMWQQP